VRHSNGHQPEIERAGVVVERRLVGVGALGAPTRLDEMVERLVPPLPLPEVMGQLFAVIGDAGLEELQLRQRTFQLTAKIEQPGQELPSDDRCKLDRPRLVGPAGT